MSNGVESKQLAEVKVRSLTPIAQSFEFAEVERMARAIATSGLFGMKTPEQALALMLLAQAEGLHPVIAARDYDIIQGRPSKKAEAMLRSFLQNGGTVEWHKLDDTCADATFSHPQGGKIRIVWDQDRANKAGLAGKEMYKKYPRQMFRARTVSEGVRTVCPMATSGLYVPEEVGDFDNKPAKTIIETKPEAAKPVQAREVSSEVEPPADSASSGPLKTVVSVSMVQSDKEDKTRFAIKGTDGTTYWAVEAFARIAQEAKRAGNSIEVHYRIRDGAFNVFDIGPAPKES